MRTANILHVDFSELEDTDTAHASPPCPNFSVAKVSGGETQGDIDLARADGFDSEEAFIDFFRHTYGLPFHGEIIKW